MFGPPENKRRLTDGISKKATRLGSNCVFRGTVKGKDDFIIVGTVIGESDVSGIIRIETTGRWEGDIKADVVIIEGLVEGSVSAHRKIELGASGKISGNLSAPAIAIAEGALFNGQIAMPGSEVTHFPERREPGKDKSKP